MDVKGRQSEKLGCQTANCLLLATSLLRKRSSLLLIVFMIIVTGSIGYDYIMEFPGKFGDHILPEHIHNVNLSFIVNNFAKRRGGTAGNVSYTMGLLNTPHVLFSYAGNDFDEYRKDFEKIGIDCSFVMIDKEKHTATGFALTDKTNNQIWGYYYGAAENNPKLELSKVVKRNDVVLIGPQGAEGSMSLVRQCMALGLSYMFDPGFILTQVSNEDLLLGLTNASYIIGNEYEVTLMKERIPSWKELAKDKTVIETLGEKGTNIIEKGFLHEIPVVQVGHVAATTGAGDAWRGGFLAGLERGFDVKVCGQMGAVASSFAIEKYGTQEHFFDIPTFLQRYKKTFNSTISL